MIMYHYLPCWETPLCTSSLTGQIPLHVQITSNNILKDLRLCLRFFLPLDVQSPLVLMMKEKVIRKWCSLFPPQAFS